MDRLELFKHQNPLTKILSKMKQWNRTHKMSLLRANGLVNKSLFFWFVENYFQFFFL